MPLIAGTHYNVMINAANHGIPNFNFVLGTVVAALSGEHGKYALREHEFPAYVSDMAAQIGDIAETIISTTPDENGRIDLPYAGMWGDLEDEYWQFEPGESNLDSMKRYLQSILDFLSDRKRVQQGLKRLGAADKLVSPPGIADWPLRDISASEKFWTFFSKRSKLWSTGFLTIMTQPAGGG